MNTNQRQLTPAGELKAMTNSVNNANTAVKAANAAQQQVIAGANNLNYGRVGAANNNAKKATANYNKTSAALKRAANNLTPLINQNRRNNRSNYNMGNYKRRKQSNLEAAQRAFQEGANAAYLANKALAVAKSLEGVKKLGEYANANFGRVAAPATPNRS